jgi:hypothetical protein
MKAEREIKQAVSSGNINKLLQFIESIRPSEIKLFRDYLVLGRVSTKKSLLADFFDFLVHGSHKIPETIYKKYPDLSPRTIDNMVIQLRDKLLAVLVDSSNYRKSDEQNTKDIALYIIKDYTKQILELKRRGVLQLAIDRVADAVTIGKEYELYADLLIVLYVKLELLKTQSDQNSIIELEAEIDFYEQSRKSTYQAEVRYKQLITLISSTAARNEHQQDILSGIAELQNLYGQSSSSLIYYYTKRLEISYYTENNSADIALAKAEELITFIKSKPALNGNPQLPIGYMFLAQSYLTVYDFDQVLACCDLIRPYFSTGSWNYGETLLLEFYANFYKNEFDLALACIDQLIDNPLYPGSKYKNAERKYLRTCCLIAMGDYKTALYELAEIYQIPKDKTGWNIGIRLWNIALSCLLAKTEQSFSHYGAFERDINRIRQQKYVRKRDILIASILRDLLKNDGNFRYVAKLRAADLEKLRSTEGEYAWRIFTHELLPFQDWFAAHLRRIPYQNTIHSQQPAKANQMS